MKQEECVLYLTFGGMCLLHEMSCVILRHRSPNMFQKTLSSKLMTHDNKHLPPNMSHKSHSPIDWISALDLYCLNFSIGSHLLYIDITFIIKLMTHDKRHMPPNMSHKSHSPIDWISAPWPLLSELFYWIPPTLIRYKKIYLYIYFIIYVISI